MKQKAHAGLFEFPGDLSNAGRACGRCHQQQVAGISAGFMHLGRGMVCITRYVFGETGSSACEGDLSHLHDTPADSLLRKLCAGCHLGHQKSQRRLDALEDRGGGCIACHLNEYPPEVHPALTASVSDARCLGCHSRSSRISLNYAGLAEVDSGALQRASPDSLGRLEDGRLVQKQPADVHHVAGMGCIDCHTGKGLMGPAHGMQYQEEAVDIACVDCHDNRAPRSANSLLVTQRFGTPLSHVEVVGNGEARSQRLYLRLKSGKGRLPIPPYSEQSHLWAREHSRLTCTVCHSQWVPQCFGCHLSYSENEPQWDHLAGDFTNGKWRQRGWDFRPGLPALGVTADERIAAFIPGMIMMVQHPSWERPKFRRRFASVSPHTTGSSRSCVSCHRSSRALGLGEGRLERPRGQWTFEPAREWATDGLPVDAWTRLLNEQPGIGARTGERSLTRAEILRVLEAKLPGLELGR